MGGCVRIFRKNNNIFVAKNIIFVIIIFIDMVFQ